MMVFKRPSNELSAYDKLVYAILCGHANRDGNAMLYVRTIAEEASCSERQAQRALSNLETRGLLVRKPQNLNGRQTFNIYEIYGFDAYISPDSSADSGQETEPEDVSASVDQGVTHSHPCQSVTPPPSDSHPRGDSQAGLNNVFEQPLFNSSKKEHIPPTPQGGAEREEKSEPENPKPQKPEHDTEGKTADQKPRPESELFEAIRGAYNSILSELPKAEKITGTRAKALRERIREDPNRKEPDWWGKFFSRVRGFPWPMGNNPKGWRADFDWLIGERGTQKILEGSFRPERAPVFGERTAEGLELQKKYTNPGGLVDAKAMLRDIEAAERRRRSCGDFGNTGEAGIGYSLGNPV
jgi:hypothetical protein